MTSTFAIQFELFEREPRFLDLDLTAWLGYKRPRDIRRLIKQNVEELERYGICPKRQAGYWLNEGQFLCLCFLSRAPRAADVRYVVIKWATGKLSDLKRGLIRPGQIGLVAYRALEELHKVTSELMKPGRPLESPPAA